MRSGTDPQQTTGQLLFSDLIRGPANSFVWLYGWTLPSNPYVTVNGVPCPEVAGTYTEGWVPANGNNPRLDRVCVQVPQGGTVSMLGASGSLTFTATGGVIHEVTTADAPFLATDYSAGDVIYLRGGTYTNVGEIFTGQYYHIFFNGQNDVHFAGYPGETAILSQQSNGISGVERINDHTNISVSNLEFHGNFSSGTQALRMSRTGNVNNLRIVGNYCTQTHATGSSPFTEISRSISTVLYGNRTYDTGQGIANGHVIYHGGRGVSDQVDISYNYLRRHNDRFMIEVYGHTAGETLANLRIQHNLLDRENQGVGTGNGIAVGGTDGGGGAPRHCNNAVNFAWINDALINSNTVRNGSTDGAIRISDAGCAYTVTDNVVENWSGADFDQCPGLGGGTDPHAIPPIITGNSWQ